MTSVRNRIIIYVTIKYILYDYTREKWTRLDHSRAHVQSSRSIFHRSIKHVRFTIYAARCNELTREEDDYDDCYCSDDNIRRTRRVRTPAVSKTRLVAKTLQTNIYTSLLHAHKKIKNRFNRTLFRAAPRSIYSMLLCYSRPVEGCRYRLRTFFRSSCVICSTSSVPVAARCQRTAYTII